MSEYGPTSYHRVVDTLLTSYSALPHHVQSNPKLLLFISPATNAAIHMAYSYSRSIATNSVTHFMGIPVHTMRMHDGVIGTWTHPGGPLYDVRIPKPKPVRAAGSGRLVCV